MAKQLLADMYGCDRLTLNSTETVANAAHNAIASLGAYVVEECCHKFEPIGISYIAVISTSHFSIHTWPEYEYAAIDVFSCTDEMPDKVIAALEAAFGANETQTISVERNIQRREN